MRSVSEERLAKNGCGKEHERMVIEIVGEYVWYTM